MKYLIWSKEHHGYWKESRFGYVYSKAEAGRFSLEDATQICEDANAYCQDDEEPEETIVPTDG